MDLERTPMFDGWLKTMLRRRFDHALDEPVPEELAAILAEAPDQHGDH